MGDEEEVMLIEDIVAVAEFPSSSTLKAIATTAAERPVVSKGRVNEEHSHDLDATITEASVAVHQPLTFRSGSINSQQRAAILLAYPLARNATRHRVLLLLSNEATVDRDQSENEFFCGGNGFCPFEFKQHRYVELIDSFMLDLYRELFIESSQQWKIHYSLIDYNLSRLRKCMQLYTKQTNDPAVSSFNELPMALEFFLQIDGKSVELTEDTIKYIHSCFYLCLSSRYLLSEDMHFSWRTSSTIWCQWR